MSDEYLLNPEESRLVTLPIKNPKIWQMYKQAQKSFWIAEHFKFSHDLPDWNEKLNNDERFFIKNILAFFAASDAIVNMNLIENFLEEIQILEAKYFYGFQYMMENIHSETYALMIDTYIKNKEEKDECFNAAQNMPCVAEKANWAIKWINNGEAPFSHRVVAFAAVEGIFFSGAFCAIFWLKQRNLMHALTESNEAISRDEGLHCSFACLLFSMLKNKPDENIIHNIIVDAVKIEKKFITESLPCKLLGMNSELMCTYIEYVADRLLSELGYSKVWNVENPFPFMDKISVISQDNFFEKTTTDYAKRAGEESKVELVDDF